MNTQNKLYQEKALQAIAPIKEECKAIAFLIAIVTLGGEIFDILREFDDSVLWYRVVSMFFSLLNLVVIVPFIMAFQNVVLAYIRQGAVDASLGTAVKDEMKARFGKYLGTSLLASLIVGLFVMLIVAAPCIAYFAIEGDAHKEAAGLVFTLICVVLYLILSLRYALIPYLIKEYPKMSVVEVLNTSSRMMKGNKWKLFTLILSYIGWLLLCVVTLGIALIWFMPRMVAAVGYFYEDIVQTNQVGNE